MKGTTMSLIWRKCSASVKQRWSGCFLDEDERPLLAAETKQLSGLLPKSLSWRRWYKWDSFRSEALTAWLDVVPELLNLGAKEIKNQEITLIIKEV